MASAAAPRMPRVENTLINGTNQWDSYDRHCREMNPDTVLLAIDCEWHDEQLCLIQLAVFVVSPPPGIQRHSSTAASSSSSSPALRGDPRPVVVFTLDCLRLDPHEIHRKVSPILCNVRYRKLMFDCREDCRMLQEHVGLVGLAGLFDLQLFEVMTRDPAAEEAAAAARRPPAGGTGAAGPPLVRVRGLKAMLGEYAALAPFVEAKAGHDLAQEGGSAVFAQRPLPQSALDYATCDVAALFPLFEALQTRPHFRTAPGRIIDETIRGTIVYSQLSSQVPPEYRRHNMLPLGVLSSIAPSRGTQVCRGCCRMVAPRGLPMCPVCHSYDRRREAMLQRDIANGRVAMHED